MVNRVDEGLTREESTEKDAGKGWSLGVSHPEEGQGKKRGNKGRAVCSVSFSHKGAFNKDKLTFITQHL